MDYMLMKVNQLFENLIVYPDNMMKNLNLTNGLIFSQEVLLKLIQAGISREDAYQLVQKNAMQVWEQKIDFKELIKTDKDISKLLSESEIDSLFDLNKILININKIFERLELNE
jgi:adenylosuccinate lyase